MCTEPQSGEVILFCTQPPLRMPSECEVQEVLLAPNCSCSHTKSSLFIWAHRKSAKLNETGKKNTLDVKGRVNLCLQENWLILTASCLEGKSLVIYNAEEMKGVVLPLYPPPSPQVRHLVQLKHSSLSSARAVRLGDASFSWGDTPQPLCFYIPFYPPTICPAVCQQILNKPSSAF